MTEDTQATKPVRKRRRQVAPTIAESDGAEITVPAPTVDVDDVRERLLAVETQLNNTFVQREEVVRVILLGVLARQNYMLVGDPGTAKTSVIDRFTLHVQAAKRFKILMGKFTQPEHVFGVLDIAAFKQGQYTTVTDNMFTDAPLPILDETLKTSDGCMNTFLGVLGPEREFQGRVTENICTGGATNWPEVDGLSKHVEALFDRFLLRCVVEPVDRADKELRRRLYRASTAVATYSPTTMVTVPELHAAADAVMKVTIEDAVIDLLDDLIGRLAPNVQVSDRRSTQLQVVLKANAWLDGRDAVTIMDFEVLKHGLWSKRRDLETIRTTLDSIDAAAVQEIVKMADEGRGAYRRLQSSGFGVAKVNEVTELIKRIAFDVQQRLQQPTFTKKGRQQVKKAMAALRQDFEDLNKRAQAQAGGQ